MHAPVSKRSLPAEVASAFVLEWDTVVFDVGGDVMSAQRRSADIIRISSILEPGSLEVLNVVNIRRPLSGTVEKLIRLQEGMQAHSRLQITGMITTQTLQRKQASRSCATDTRCSRKSPTGWVSPWHIRQAKGSA